MGNQLKIHFFIAKRFFSRGFFGGGEFFGFFLFCLRQDGIYVRL